MSIGNGEFEWFDDCGMAFEFTDIGESECAIATGLIFALVDSVFVRVYNLEYCDPVCIEKLRYVGRGLVIEL